MFIWN